MPPSSSVASVIDDPAKWSQGPSIASGVGAGGLALVPCALLLVSTLALSRQPQLAACRLLRLSGRATRTSGCSSSYYVEVVGDLGWFGGGSWPLGSALFVIFTPKLNSPH